MGLGFVVHRKHERIGSNWCVQVWSKCGSAELVEKMSVRL